MPLIFEEYKQQAHEKKTQYEEALKVRTTLVVNNGFMIIIII